MSKVIFAPLIVGCLLGIALSGTNPSKVSAQSGGGASNAFAYPGSPVSVKSPSGRAELTVNTLPPDKNGLGGRVLSLSVEAGRTAQYRFDRRIDGQWSPSGQIIFLNDYQGSDVVDCLIPYRSDKEWTFESLTEILLKNKYSGPVTTPGIKPPETTNNSHFYLTCTRWISEKLLEVRLRGITLAGGEFLYNFKFNIPMKHFEINSDRD